MVTTGPPAHQRTVLPRLVTATTVLVLALVAEAQELPPTRKGPLLRWLRAGSYATWTAEPAVRPSATAHTRYVRTFVSPTLAEDLAAGRSAFRRGAAMIKEIYGSSPDRVVGWAVMRKVRARSGGSGRGWYFYETLDGSNAGAIAGRGKSLCTGCHRDGTDFLLTPFRP